MPPRKRDRLKKLAKTPKGERNASRSHGGFLLAALAVVGGLAASIWRAHTACHAGSRARVAALRARVV